MDITELEYRELTSLRDRLRNRLKKQLEEGLLSVEKSKDEKLKLRVAVDHLRVSIGDAYRERDIDRMRVYSTFPGILMDGNAGSIDWAITDLRAGGAHHVVKEFGPDHLAAYRRIALLIPEVQNGNYRYDIMTKYAVVALVLSNLTREQTVFSIIKERDTLDVDLIQGLLNETNDDAPALMGGVL